jgi:hypothetical protein
MVEDYPRTVLELERRFGSEEACCEYLGRLRWPDGFVCPRCGRGLAWPASRGRLVCRACRHQTSVTAGTIFQDTRKPLVLWFRAVWCVTSQKNGTSAASIQRILGLGSYETAWTWLHKLRRAMVRPGREQLHGRVEVDETFLVGEDSTSEVARKPVVIIAAEEDGSGIGRIRLARVPAPTRKNLHRFVQQAIQPGSRLHTDGRTAWDGIETLGYKRRRTVLLKHKEPDAACRLLPRVHRVASLLKRWLWGTHQGAVGVEHLDYYLDEFTFRFNRRTSRSRGKLFYRLVQQAVQVPPAPYHQLVHDHKSR